jgi:YD repeat-containing protein
MTQDAQGNTVEYGYDKNDNLTDLTDSRGTITHWDYDTRNRQIDKISSDGSEQTYNYTLASVPGGGTQRSHALVSKTDELGHTTNYGYDADDNLTGIAYAHSAPIAYSYDALNRRVGMSDGTGSTTWSYDNLSRCTGETGPFAAAVSYSYDTLNRRSTMAVNGDNGSATAGASPIAYAYDALDRATTLTAPEGTYTSGYLNNSGLVSSLALPNGATVQNGYDAFERLTSISNQTNTNANLISYAYAYQPASGSGSATVAHDARTGLQRQANANAAQSVSYSYDNIDELLNETSSETPNPLLNNSYAYL